MTYREAVRQFKRRNINLWINQVDYWTAWEIWDAYVDGLCKDGQITEKQFNNWATPFPYGKPLPKPRLVY